MELPLRFCPMSRFLQPSLLVMGLALLLTACSLTPSEDLDSTAGFIEVIEEKQAEWEEANINSYEIQYNRLVDGRLFTDVTVTVEGDSLVEARFGGERITEDGVALTIDDMYTEMIDLLNTDGRGPFSYRFRDGRAYPDFYRMRSGESVPATGVEIATIIFPDDDA